MSPTTFPDRDVALRRVDDRSALLARNWGLIAFRGLLAILFGIGTFLVPGLTLITLVYLFAAYLIVDGVFAIGAGIRAAQAHGRWGLLILEGVVDILAALAAFLNPGIAVAVFVYLIAAWSLMSGVILVVAAFQLHLDHGRWLMALAGIASVIFGIVLAVAPIAGAVVLAYWLAGYAFAFGIVLVILAFRLRARHAG